MSNKKTAKRMADELNGIIHSRNLYSFGRRYMNAHVVKLTGEYVIGLEDLQDGSSKLFKNDGSFVDGYGQEVVV
jgi:hypothetical protein